MTLAFAQHPITTGCRPNGVATASASHPVHDHILCMMGYWAKATVIVFSIVSLTAIAVVLLLTTHAKGETGWKRLLRQDRNSTSGSLSRRAVWSLFTGGSSSVVGTSQSTFVRRRNAVRAACRQRGGKELSATESRVLYSHLIVDDGHKLIYCYVEKVACTSWKSSMLVLTGSADSASNITSTRIHDRREYKTMAQLSSSERERRLKTYTKFMVHRDPLGRLLSAYVDKCVKRDYCITNHGRQIRALRRVKRREASNKSSNDVEFREFSELVLRQAGRSLATVDGHWRPQVYACQPCTVDYEYYSEMGTVESDAKTILESVGASNKLKFPHSNTATSGRNMTYFYEQLDNILMGRLLKIYKDDYALFGYKKPELYV